MSFPMLATKLLINVLNKITLTEGIEDTIILSNAGEVLAYSGNDEKNFVDIISAVTSNMWLTLQNSGEAALNEDYLNIVLVKCEDGKILIQRIAEFLLCIRAKQFVGFGLLKQKSQLLKEYCEHSLKELP